MTLPVELYYVMCVLAGIGAGAVCTWSGYWYGRTTLARALQRAMRDHTSEFYIPCETCQGSGRKGPTCE